MNIKLMKVLFYTGVGSLVILGCFFILKDAEWLIGDDSIACSRTGWGIPFSLKDFTIPDVSRFYPMAYMMYNVLVWIGAYSITAHFALHAVIFALLMLGFVYLCRLSLTNEKLSNWDYLTIFAASIIMFARVYGSFVTTRYTLWVDFFMLVVWLLCTFYVHERKNIWMAVLGLIAMTYFVYCLEVNFTLPFCYGFCGLLFGWKRLSKMEKTYLFSMIGIALLYLILYYFLVYIHRGPTAYDASHGSEDNIIVNALKMLYAQKILLVAVALLCVRFYTIIKNGQQYSWYDTLLLSGFGLFVGCCVLHLNHTIYFYMSLICVFPAVLHYLREYVNPKWTAAIFVLLALIMCRKLPVHIKDSIRERAEATQLWMLLKEKYTEGAEFYYYSPHSDMVNTNEYVWRDQLEGCLGTLLRYKVNDKQLNINHIEIFNSQVGIYILPKQNDKLIPLANEIVMEQGNVLSTTCGETIVEIK